MSSSSVFAAAQKELAKRALHAIARDAEGNELAVDVRDDSEQQEKYNLILAALLSAGYHRVRITTLSPFDKVVGGLAWAITASNVSVELDFLFQDDFDIGEKIALTEKIVQILPKMGCAMRLEPHQIQGLDCISIYPIMQWLAHKVIETRQLLGDYVRLFAEAQFAKLHIHRPDVEASMRAPIMRPDLQHDGIMANLDRQIAKVTERIEVTKGTIKECEIQRDDLEAQLGKARAHSKRIEMETAKMNQHLTDQDIAHLNEVQETLSYNTKVKQQITVFKADCRTQADDLNRQIEIVTRKLESGQDLQHSEKIKQKLLAVKQRHDLKRLALAKVNRELVKTQRILDSVPTRTELNQYQRRFIELYDQMYRQREVDLLNSVLDTFPQAMIAKRAGQEFMKQLVKVAEGVAASLEKMKMQENITSEEKKKLKKEYQDLVEMDRLYFRLIKEFQEECRKNERLLTESNRVQGKM